MSGLGDALIQRADHLNPILDEIAEAKIALANELAEDRPNEKTVNAIKGRIADLDRAAAGRMVWR